MRLETRTIVRLRDALLQSGRRPSLVLSPAYETLARQGILSAEERTALARVDPLGETLFLMMSVDGKLSEAERDAIRGAIRGLTDNILRSGTINVMLETYRQRLDEHGRDARLYEIAEELADETADAESAFALAAAVALADEEVAVEESAFIKQVADVFGIRSDRASEIIEQLEQDRATR
jgi:uncharacterized tellurite resistance protein B-like protein